MDSKFLQMITSWSMSPENRFQRGFCTWADMFSHPFETFSRQCESYMFGGCGDDSKTSSLLWRCLQDFSVTSRQSPLVSARFQMRRHHRDCLRLCRDWMKTQQSPISLCWNWTCLFPPQLPGDSRDVFEMSLRQLETPVSNWSLGWRARPFTVS